MSSQRKSASPTRAAKPVKHKAARPGKSAAKARPRSAGAAATRHARPAKPTRKTPVPKKKVVTVQKKATPPKKAAPVSKKAAPAPRKTAKKGAPVPKKTVAKVVVPAAKALRRRLKAVPRPPTPGPTVRPLGVLPPEARARGVERQAHGPAVPAQSVAVPARPAKPGPKAPGAQRVTEKDLKELEALLLAERVRVMKEMGHLESTVLKVNPRESAGDLSGYSFHMADAGTDAYEREKAFQFASNEGRLLLDLDEALRRLYRGEYGSCESCGNAIAKARLEAMPTARLCRDCKEMEEREPRPQQ